jgi:hypothetical protein
VLVGDFKPHKGSRAWSGNVEPQSDACHDVQVKRKTRNTNNPHNFLYMKQKWCGMTAARDGVDLGFVSQLDPLVYAMANCIFFIKNLAANQPIKNALYLTNQTAFLIKNLAANQPNKVIVIAYTPDFFQNTAKWPIYHVNDLFWGNVSYIQRVPCAHALNLGRINEIQRQLKIFAD